MKPKFSDFIALDNQPLEIISTKIDDKGYLVINCNFARTGIQERLGQEIDPSLDATKIYKEYRSPKEVFKSSVLEGFRTSVITNEHPNYLLDSLNTKAHAVGFVSSNVEVIDEKYLKTQITIYDKETIEDIQEEKIELSAGYLYSLTFVEDKDYDYIQTDIKPNHIAIVQAGRCGSECSIALDNKPNLKGKENMKIVFKRYLPNGEDKVIAEIEVSDDELAKTLQGVADSLYDKSKKMEEDSISKDEELETAKDELETAKDELETTKEALDKATAENDVLKQQKPAKDCDILKTMALDFASIIAAAKDCGVDTKELKTALDMKKAVITKVAPSMALDNKPEAYVDSAYDIILDQLKGADDSFLKGLNLQANDKKIDEESKKENDSKTGFDKKYGGNE